MRIEGIAILLVCTGAVFTEGAVCGEDEILNGFSCVKCEQCAEGLLLNTHVGVFICVVVRKVSYIYCYFEWSCARHSVILFFALSIHFILKIISVCEAISLKVLGSFKAKLRTDMYRQKRVALQVSDILMVERLKFGPLFNFHCFTCRLLRCVFNFHFRRVISVNLMRLLSLANLQIDRKTSKDGSYTECYPCFPTCPDGYYVDLDTLSCLKCALDCNTLNRLHYEDCGGFQKGQCGNCKQGYFSLLEVFNG